ncbi:MULTISPECIES: ATP-binding protein [Nostocales]|nr:ATP-binding protein [Tolypothrix sp. PCC 7601]MBE9083336.1 response regulator [Tolypothrix sp. LEGE 11397]UYD29765.1 response regulator [Tolypothrix sp. PCC 7712]UYD37800.1 response regulator [Tolypothrix sp. PCC 7601]BAY92870.1 putative sensor protein [Microchaete diplosiphon NIES-3275]
MAVLMPLVDWSTTAVGAVETWPQCLKTAVRIMLGSRYPMFVWWGESLTKFYNDAYIPVLGQRHPQALGQPASQVWAEIWDTLGPQAEAVMQKGQSSWNEELLLVMQRNGYTEETYFTFSYSPIIQDDGTVGGVFCACTEETRRVVGDRRLRSLRELAANTAEAKTVEDACEISAQTLDNNPYDVPFALLYLLDEKATQAQLVGATRLDAGTTASPQFIDINADSQICDRWLLPAVLADGKSQLVDLVKSGFGDLPGGAWPESPTTAVVLPLTTPTQERLSGFLIAGISPRRQFDDDYQGFWDLVAGQISTAIANARAYEAERLRAEALAEIDRAKTEFFSNVSHEFRTPLTLMLGPLEDALTDNTASLPAIQRERIEIVQRNGLRLLKLVNTLLDFSRIEAGRIQAVYEPTDLATFTAELASAFRSTIEQAGMQLIVDCPALPAEIYVDREMWEKIVFNLLSNAFKFTFSGTITVKLEYFKNHVNLLVQDTGIGIPSEEIPNLFKRFHRIKGSHGRSFEGSGIGLSLVREIVELHGGKVSVTSVWGGGSCFTVTIPTGCAHLPAESLRAIRTSTSTASGAIAYVEEARRWGTAESRGDEGDEGDKGDEGDVDAKRLPDKVGDVITYSFVDKTARILLADDNADMRDYLRRFLSNYYQVETVGDGIAALNTVRQNPPNLVLTDVMMPGIDGFELLRSLRNDPKTQYIPIILLSARAGEESRIEGLAAGADDYIVKPFSAKELLARIEASLKLSQLRQEAQLREKDLRMQAEAALSDRQQIEASLRESEERFRQMAETIENVFWLCDASAQKLLYVSPAYQQVWGRSPELLYHDLSSWIETIHPDDQDLVIKATEKCITNGNHSEEYRIIRPDGTIRWIRDRGFLVQDGERKPYRIAGVAEDISDRKQVEQERELLLLRERAAREEAERASRIKDEFLAVLSHELRSPLNPILGWSKLLQNGKLSPSATAAALATIERNAKLQVQLIDDLLDVSRILRGKLVLNAIPLDLCSIISSALETVRLAAEAKSLEIHTHITPKVSVIGDPTRLQQVVWNILSNAVKFTPSGGKIEVGLTCVGTNAQIQVRDTGKGISAEFLPYVFEHFQQEDGSTTRQFGGLGLGLAIVRQLVELHGGTVAVDSAGEGQGATFTVYIPLAKNPVPTPALPASEPQNVNLEGINILVVDDEPDSREFLTFVLTQQQATVTTVASGAEALQVLAQAVPDLLISDIGMPEMDGYMLMQTIRASQPDKFLPAIALTAYAGELNQQKAIAAGFQKHIVKPIDPNTVVAIAIELLQPQIINRR